MTDAERVFVVMVPTLDGTGNLALMNQIARATQLLMEWGKKETSLVVVQDKVGVAACREMAVRRVAQALKVPAFNALMCDSDVNIETPEALAWYVDWVESQSFGTAIMPSVRLKGPVEDIYSGGASIDTETEDLAVIHPKGMGGLFYGPFTPDYRWHSDGSASEDAYYLLDMGPKIQVHFAKRLKVSHYARVKLSPP
jgi:hypothetical protein